MNNIYKLLIGLALVVSSIALYSAMSVQTVNPSDVQSYMKSLLGGVTNYDALELEPQTSSNNALKVSSSNGTSSLVVDGSGNVSFGANGTNFTQYRCDTSTWDPGSVSSSTDPQTLDISNTGASLGDVCDASFDSATSTAQWQVSCQVTASGTSTIEMVGVDGQSAVDISTSTAKVCTRQ